MFKVWSPYRGRHAALVTVLCGSLLALIPHHAQATPSVTLAWNASPGTNIVGYNLYYGVSSGVYTNVLPAGNVTNAVVSNLVQGVTYYFAATSLSDIGLESVYSTEVSYAVPVSLTNQPPTLNPIPNVTINENAGLQTVNLSGITSGSTNQTQTLTVTASCNNTGLIPTPTVNYTSPNTTGSLSFAPVLYASGTALITVTVNNGGLSNNLFSQTFTVTVNPVNQAPTLNSLSNLTINENATAQTVNLSGITSGATNEFQTLTVTASSSNPGLIPTPTVTYTSPNTTGSVSFAPVLYASGSATITVTVNDGGLSNNITSRSFTVTVNPVNQPPTLNALSNLTLNENAGPQTVNLSGITSGATNEVQTLTVTASSSNPGLIPTPTVTYTSPNTTGSLAFAPALYASGSATITVTVNDGGLSNNITSRSFTVTVNAVNQPPTLNPLPNLTIVENAGLQTVNLSGITSGATNEFQTLTVTANSGNTALIPRPTVSYTSPNTTGSISFTPVLNAFGSATVTVTVNDGGTSNNVVSRSFTVTVDQPPIISAISNLAIAVNTSTQPIPFTIGDADTPLTNLTVSATSSNQTLVQDAGIVLGGSGTSRTITVTPVTGQVGVATITVSVSDGIATTATSFILTVEGQPSPPGNLHVAGATPNAITIRPTATKPVVADY